MNNQKMFSIVVLNYNNFDYLFNMIDSIYNQSYKNMELIIMDDASNYFDKDKILEYIKNKKRKINVKVFINENNIGTVKTINKALEKVSGDYYLFTASDDALANNEVISNFVKYFDNTSSNVITSQWIKCDNNLNIIGNYIPKLKFRQYNKNPKKLLFEMCKCNRFGAGATAYRKEVFDKYKFDESYIYLEDWPFWLKLLFDEEKIYFARFDGLLHRSGGLSEPKEIMNSTRRFYKELLETFHKEIIPNLDKFTNHKKWSILESYKYSIGYYGKYVDTKIYKKELNMLISDKKIKKYCILNELNPHLINKIEMLNKYNNIVPRTFILTIISSFIMTNFIENNNLKILFIIITYLIIYIGLVFIREVRSRKKWKNIQ